jgi:acetolactate synthase I/II/III large subunit
MKASDLFARCLEQEGVRYVFGVPGEENEDLLFSLAESSVRFIPTRHEQGAAFMADMWGRLTGQAGVCLSTLGPGATNLVTGVADAFLDKSPLVAITGQIDVEQFHQESHQRIDVLGMLGTVTKWNSGCVDPDVIPEIVRKAFKVAEDEKPGPTHIELPEDIAALQTNAVPITRRDVRRPDPDRLAVEQAVDLLVAAKRPLIIAGNGALRKRATRQLRAIVKKFRIPVVHTFMGKGAIDDRWEESLFTMGMGLRDYVLDAVEQCDLIVAVGFDLGEYSPQRWNPKGDKRIIHIDFTPADVYGQYQPLIEIVADPRATLREMHRHLRKRATPAFDATWYHPIRERIWKDIRSYDLKENSAFTVPGVINVLRDLLGEEDLLLSDVGAHKLWIARNYATYRPNRCIISNGLASMGFALPGAIGAALAEPDRAIVAAMGDGGFLMNSQELETAKRLGVGFICLVFNDNDYGLISWKQQTKFGRSTGTQLTNPDFVKYAESFGIPAYRPASVSELRHEMAKAIASKKLCFFEIPVDPRVNMELTAKLSGAVPKED